VNEYPGQSPLKMEKLKELFYQLVELFFSLVIFKFTYVTMYQLKLFSSSSMFQLGIHEKLVVSMIVSL